MTFQLKINQAHSIMLSAFAEELSKHKLKPKMTPEEILAFFDFDAITLTFNGSSKSTPNQKDLPEWEGTLGDVPEGISKKRALQLLAMAQAGVPEGQKIHTKNADYFTPNKQHAKFYTKSCFSGPAKDTKVIDWLADLAGEISTPPEPDVVAELPQHKWDGDKKKAINLIKLVEEHKKKAKAEGKEFKYVSWDTSRGRDQGIDELLYSDEYQICGPKQYKSEFLNLVAWFDENQKLVEDARQPPKKVAAKGKGKGKKSKDDESEEASEQESEAADADDDESDGESKKKAAPAKAAKGKKAAPKEEVSEESSADDAEKDDDESSADEEGPTFVLDFDEKKLAKLQAKLKKVVDEESEKFVNGKTGMEITRNAKSEGKFVWFDELKLAIPKDLEYVSEDFVKMLGK